MSENPIGLEYDPFAEVSNNAEESLIEIEATVQQMEAGIKEASKAARRDRFVMAALTGLLAADAKFDASTANLSEMAVTQADHTIAFIDRTAPEDSQ